MFECTNIERGWYRRECLKCTSRRRREEGFRARDEIARRTAYQREYAKAHSERLVAKAASWNRANPERRRVNALNYYYRLQDAAMQAYGGYRCLWCGMDDPIVLTIDHINNDGAHMRKRLKKDGAAFYKWLRDNNYPAGFQVLCMNCNHAKMRNGGVLPERLKGRCNDHPERE